MSEAFPVVEGLLNIKTKFCLYTFRFLSGVSFATFQELSTWNFVLISLRNIVFICFLTSTQPFEILAFVLQLQFGNTCYPRSLLFIDIHEALIVLEVKLPNSVENILKLDVQNVSILLASFIRLTLLACWPFWMKSAGSLKPQIRPLLKSSFKSKGPTPSFRNHVS